MKFIKNNLLYFLFIIVIIITTTIAANKVYTILVKPQEKFFANVCETYKNQKTITLGDHVFNSDELEKWAETYGKYCGKNINNYWYENFMQGYSFSDIFSYSLQALPIFLIITICAYLYKTFRTGFFKNELTRQKYKEVIYKHIIKTYKLSTLIAVSALIIIIIFSFISQDNYAIASYFHDRNDMPIYFINKPLFFTIVFLLNHLLIGLFIANICLIVNNYVSNMPLATIISFIVYYIYDICAYIILGFIEYCFGIYVLKFDYNLVSGVGGNFQFETSWVMLAAQNPLVFTIYLCTIFFISFLIVVIMYDNKEKVIMEYEK